MMLIANPCFGATNQNKLIRNPEMKNDMLVSETIFKMEGSSLVKYMKHNYKYDDQKQRTEDESLKWNPTGERWENDLCILTPIPKRQSQQNIISGIKRRRIMY